jgi:hypothetical protein
MYLKGLLDHLFQGLMITKSGIFLKSHVLRVINE